MVPTNQYVQLAESAALREADPEVFRSLETVIPSGAAFPESCRAKIQAKMKNLKV